MAELNVLHGLLKRSQQLDQDLWNVAKAMLPPNSKVQYKVGERQYFGKVIELVGAPGRNTTRVRLENVVTLKRRDVLLSDITGLVREL